VRAAQVIPGGATYSVVVGDQLHPTYAQRAAIPDLLRYWLLPRRRVDALDRAEWVITYGQATEALNVRASREISLAPKINAVELERR
jgi:hypothetical protein